MYANRTGDVRWDDLRLLLAVARTGSFLAAGRELEAATSTLSRRLARLEAVLGAPLLERRNDGVRLTEVGGRLAETAAELDLAVSARLRDLPTSARILEGTIRGTAGDGFTGFVVETIAAFAERHPGVSFELVIEGRALDLVHREADVAIRTGHGREGSLIYRTLGRLAYGLWASRDYTERRGLPRTLAQLPGHSLLGFAAPLDRLPVMRWLRAAGVRRFTLRATSFAPLLAAAHAGLGIAPLPEILGDGLVRVLPRAALDPLTVYLVTHPAARRLPHVRAFVDVVARRFVRGAAPVRA